ncbi:MAG: Trm112 family protein [Armatimonadetes bacterium]|nr:Trm112 family protein [Armatimonadota bacterium]
MDEKLLEILACPVCKMRVEKKGEDRLLCPKCRRVYPIQDGIPVMLVDEATFEGGAVPEGSGSES